jgi:hypothetical protein
MSTYFYYRKATAKKVDEERDLIGLRANGIFLFRTYPRRGLTTSAEWKKFLANGRVIVDERDRVYTPEEFSLLLDQLKDTERVEYKNSPELPPGTRLTKDIRRYRDQDGHVLCNYVFC